MEFIRDLHNLRPQHDGCVLTIGKFDGVHQGHKAVLRNLRLKAKELGMASMVMVFEPQPEEVFAPSAAPARLSTVRDKISLLEAEGVDRMLCVRFSDQFSKMSAESFIHDLLIKKLGIRFLVVGDDFRFGFKRKGDFQMLNQTGLEEGFDVVSTESYRVDTLRISSTAVRESLASGDFDKAREMLGRDFFLAGKVVHGEKNGRQLGFPTANVLLKRHKSPLLGVFACHVQINGKLVDSVVNIGQRPTLNGTRVQLEANLFDFNQDIYGQRIEVIPKQKIREEQKFESLDALKRQIKKDASEARRFFASMN